MVATTASPVALLAILCSPGLLCQRTAALDNGAGALPALGWSSWNLLGNNINEAAILEIADALVDTGLSKLGYRYINIDAGAILRSRDPKTGKPVVNPAKFPRGMRAVADSIHAKGLLLGVYTDISNHECGTGPGSQSHYQIDADTYALDWQVDYLKVDFCGPTNGPTGGGKVSTQPVPQYAAFKALGDALNATNRSIYYSICPDTVAPALGTAAEWSNKIELGITGFIHCTPTAWTATERHTLANSLLIEYTNTFDAWYIGPGRGGMIGDIDSMLQMTDLSYGVPGSWNDADMLQTCNYGKGNSPGSGMTLAEYRAHYSVWAVLASPLILGNDLRTVGRDHPDCLALLLNPEIVAVNQDSAARAPVLISQAANPPNKNRSAVPDGKHTLTLVPCNSSSVGVLPWKLESDHSLRAGGSAEGCLDAYECATADGTRLSVFGCHPNNTCPSKLKGCMCGYTNQQWTVANGTIRNINSSACLTARTVHGHNSVVLSKCSASSAAAQSFSLSEVGEVIWASGTASNSCLIAGAYIPAAPPAGGPTSLDITAQIVARPMGPTAAPDDIAVVMLNRAAVPTKLSVSWAELGIAPGQHMHVRDVVNRKDLPVALGEFSAMVDSHDVSFIRLTNAPTATSRLELVPRPAGSSRPAGFSWERLPVHWFSGNSTDQLSAAAAHRIASRHSLAIINGQGHAYWQAPVGAGAEGKMIEAGRMLKRASAKLGRPAVAVLAYFNSVLDWSPYDFHAWMQADPSRYLAGTNGKPLTGRRDNMNRTIYLPDWSQSAVKERWLSNVINTSQQLDGVFVDQAQFCDGMAKCGNDRMLPPAKSAAYAAAHWGMIMELRQRLPDQIIILNTGDRNNSDWIPGFAHEYVSFNGSLAEIESLQADAAHGDLAICRNNAQWRYPTTLASFLLGASAGGDNASAAYFAAPMRENFEGESPADPGWLEPQWDGWRPEYSKALGAPLSAAKIHDDGNGGGVAVRRFASGTVVTMDLAALADTNSTGGGCVCVIHSTIN
jgi:alpha-galactosidase